MLGDCSPCTKDHSFYYLLVQRGPEGSRTSWTQVQRRSSLVSESFQLDLRCGVAHRYNNWKTRRGRATVTQADLGVTEELLYKVIYRKDVTVSLGYLLIHH